MADNEVQIDSLSIAIEESANAASKNLTALSTGLKKLGQSVSGLKLDGAVSQLTALTTAVNGIGNSADKLMALASSLLDLKSVGRVDAAVPKSLSNQIAALDKALGGLTESDIKRLTSLSSALNHLGGIEMPSVSASIGHQLSGIGDALKKLQGADFSKVSELAIALQPLANLGRSQLTSFINQLGKLPQLSKDLEAVDMDRFVSTVERLTAAIKPLAEEMDKIARGFAAFPQRIQKFIANNEKAASSAKTSKSKWNGFFNTLINGSAKSSSGLTKLAKQMISVATLRATAIKIKDAIESANEYIESLNLFNVSMGRFTEEGQKYAELVGDSYGIDPAEFMKMQAVVMDMSKSFGVSSDTAYTMSKALTQLTYDISSLYNLKIDEAASKVQSALAGEIEPIRRLGKDLSVANLKLLATELGINSNVDAMNQAEKAMLRTVSLLRQSTSAMGDMARTLEQPANQFRVLKAQLELLSRALGDLFLPVVQKILPYFTAFIKVTRQVVMAFAELAGFKLPEFDYVDSVDNITEVGDAADDTAKSVKKLYLLSFDELNILGNKNSSGTGTGTGLSAEELAKLEAELNRLAKIEDDLFSKSLGEATDKIAENMEQWLTKGKGIKEWAKDVAGDFERIRNFAAGIADKLGLWKIPEALSSLLSSFGLNIDFDTLNIGFGKSRLGAVSGGDNLKTLLGSGLGLALGIGAVGALTGSSSAGGLLAKGLGLALSLGSLKMLFDDMTLDEVDSSATNGLHSSFKRALEFALMGAGLSLISGKGLKYSLGVGLNVATLALGFEGITGLWDNDPENDLASTVKLGIASALGGASLMLVGGAGMLKYTLPLALAIDSVTLLYAGAKAFGNGNELLGIITSGVGAALAAATGGVIAKFIGASAIKGAGLGLAFSIPLAISFTLEQVGFYDKIKGWGSKQKSILKEKLDKTFGEKIDTSGSWGNTTMSVVKKAGEYAHDLISSVFESHTTMPKDTTFTKVGENIVDGINEGMTNHEKLLKRGTSKIAEAIDEQFRNDLGIHSPSTVFEDHGLNIDKGLADGVINNLGVITDAFGTVYTSIELRFDSFAESMLVKAQELVERMARIFSKMSFAVTPSLSISSYSGRVPAYASGGFPEDGMFFANSGELVGRFANGRTAVANNEEIISGIANGVREANNELIGVIYSTARQVVQAMQNGSNVYIDGKKISKSVTDAQNRSNRMHGASQQNV